MPLRDHFRPPLSLRRHWHAFYNAWATYIAADLNRRLPSGYFAEPNVQFGIEVDVAAFEEGPPEFSQLLSPGEDAPLFHPTAPQYTLPFTLAADTVEVTISTKAMILSEVTLIGSQGGTKEDVKGVYDFLATGKLDPVLTEITFDDIPAGIDRLAKGQVVGRLVAKYGD